MKNNLENSFHESLKDFEMPYNPKAWNSMRSKLDAKMPVKTNRVKWYVSAGVILVALVVSSLYFFPSNDTIENVNSVTKNNSIVTNQKEELNDKVLPQENKSALTIINEKDNNVPEDNTSSVQKNNDELVTSNVETKEEKPVQSTKTTITTDTDRKINGANNPSVNREENHDDEPATSIKEVVLPTIHSICVGESIKIENINDVKLVIGGPWFKEVITPHSSKSILFKNEGTYIIGTEEEGSEVKTFTVHKLPEADFSVYTDIKYEDGLPTVELINNSGKIATWKYNNITLRGAEVKAHFFKKGNHTVKMSVESFHGCKNSIEKEIYIDEKYNLLAVNSFIPQDIDIRKNTFMPFALTQRKDVQFTLIILDPNDGHVVYKTSDVTAGWNGIDQQTGQAVQYEKAYIWKVTIANPTPGENSEYAGTITPLTK